jgi:hypothetical protein
MSEDIIKLMRITQAEGVARGLFSWGANDGILITEKGKKIAYEKWEQLPPLDRLLFGWLNRSLQNPTAKEGKN